MRPDSRLPTGGELAKDVEDAAWADVDLGAEGGVRRESADARLTLVTGASPSA